MRRRMNPNYRPLATTVSFTERGTHVHRQAVLHDLIPLGRGSKSVVAWAYDPLNRVWSNHHLFRASVTLSGSDHA